MAFELGDNPVSTIPDTAKLIVDDADVAKDITWAELKALIIAQPAVLAVLVAAAPTQGEKEALGAALGIPILTAAGVLLGNYQLADASGTALAADQIAADALGRLVIGDGVTAGGRWVNPAREFSASDGDIVAATRFELARWAVDADRLAAGSRIMLEISAWWAVHGTGNYNDCYFLLDVDPVGNNVAEATAPSKGLVTMPFIKAADALSEGSTVGAHVTGMAGVSLSASTPPLLWGSTFDSCFASVFNPMGAASTTHYPKGGFTGGSTETRLDPTAALQLVLYGYTAETSFEVRRVTGRANLYLSD